MSVGFAIHNAPTTHGGRIPATQMRASQMGNLFVVAGDGHFCPKCKVWSTVQKSHDHVIFDGHSVAYANDLLSCGARILPQQSHVVGDSQGQNYRSSTPSNILPSNSQQNLASSLTNRSKEKIVTEVFWSYGEKLTPLVEKSRFFDDLNLHIETIGYSEGEQIEVEVSPDSADLDTFQGFSISIIVNNEGSGIFKNVFKGKTIIIDTEY